jgi:hypothetical protein
MSSVLLNTSILAIYGNFDNFGIIGFLFFDRIPVDSSHFSLHIDSILSPKVPKYFILNVLKRSLILAYGPTGGWQSWRM